MAGLGTLRRAANVADTAQKVGRVSNIVPTSNNYRDLFQKAYGQLDAGVQVHHTIPQKYESLFKQAGINVHELKYLEAVHEKIHRQITNEWKQWDSAQKGDITIQSVQDFAKQIEKQFSKHYQSKSKK